MSLAAAYRCPYLEHVTELTIYGYDIIAMAQMQNMYDRSADVTSPY